MSEALFRIPSRTVTYGYVEVSVDLGHSDPEIIAATYVSWVHAFQKEELATIERLSGQAKPAATASQPAGVAMDAPSGALKAPLAASEEYSEEGARRIIEDGLGPVTELPGGSDALIADNLEAEARAPWKQEVALKPKPWETGTEKPNRPVHPIVTPDW